MSDDWLLAGPTAPDDVRRHYDEWAWSYDASLAAWGYDAPSRGAALLTGSLTLGSRSVVLDAGCGTGLAGAALRSAGYEGRLEGIDLSDESLGVAGARSAYDDLAVADLQQPLTAPDDHYDAATCIGVLTYVPDTEAIWRELSRATRPGGVVVCTQRDDVWNERRCAEVLDRLERDGTWVALHLSPALAYMPGNPAFGHEIGVRYLVARVR